MVLLTKTARQPKAPNRQALRRHGLGGKPTGKAESNHDGTYAVLVRMDRNALQLQSDIIEFAESNNLTVRIVAVENRDLLMGVLRLWCEPHAADKIANGVDGVNQVRQWTDPQITSMRQIASSLGLLSLSSRSRQH